MIGDRAITSRFVGTQPVIREYLGNHLTYEAVTSTLEMTVLGTTFEPQLELALASTSEVTWRNERGELLGEGLTPSISWGTAGPHTVRIFVTIPEDVVTLNLGFHEDQDNGIHSLPASYRWPTQPVTSVVGLQNLPGLQRFMAARTNGVDPDGSLYTGPLLTGHLDFSGMASLEYVECFMAAVNSVDLTGCTSLLRLCLEQCDLTELDLNPVRDSLLDLRAAFQIGSTLTLTPLTGPLSNVYHFCTRRQTLVGFPDSTLLPKVQQLWTWRNSLDVPEMIVRSTAPLDSVLVSSSSAGGTENLIRRLDLAGQTWASLGGAVRLHAFGVGMETIDITGMGALPTLHLYNNLLDEASVDHVLTVVDSWGTSGGTLRLEGNAPPSSSGLALVDILRSRSWTVQHEAPRTLVWSDEFDRADAVGFANSGGWHASPADSTTDVDADIVSGALVLRGSAGYRRVLHPAGASLPSNIEVEIGFTRTEVGVGPGLGTYWGIASHFSGTNSGRRVLFVGSPTTLRIGNTSNTTDGGDTDVSALLPSTWGDVGQHALTLRTMGSTTTVLADGVPIASRAFSNNASLVGGEVGFVGEPRDRAWDYIRVYSI